MQSIQAGVNAKLLVVIDDDPLVLEAMEGLLRQWGYEVVTAASDGSALAKLAERRRSPDLIVCDYHLSGGTTGIEAIGSLQRAFPIPAFLISADGAVAESAQVRDIGVPVLRKPLDVKVLCTTLRQALHKVAPRQ
jgi:CheY-like chemotaxis protein